VGWNLAQQEVSWHVCVIWVPWPASQCSASSTVTDKLVFYPNGTYEVTHL